MERWHNIRPWLIIFIGLVLVGVTLLFLKKPIELIDYVAVVGSYASLMGIAITISQVSSVQNEVKKNSRAIRTSQSIASFNKASGWIEDILHAITLKEYGLAHSKTAELVSFLVEQKSNKKLIVTQEWDDNIDSLTMASQSLCKKMMDSNYCLNMMGIVDDLEKVRKLLATVSGDLINESYETGNN